MKTSTSTHHHLILLSLFLLLTTQVTAQTRTIQDPNGDSTNLYPSYPGYSRFNSSLAIIIAVLVTSIFFMVFFFVYIRYCTAPSSSVRPPIVVRATAALRGLDASVIDTFPTFSYSEVKDHKIGKEALECAVCLNEFEDDETLRLLPKCDHVFHPECIDAWLKLHVTCPVCRADLVPRPGDHSINVIGSTGISEEGSNGEASAVDNLGSKDVVIQIDEGSNRLERPKMVNRNLSFQNLNRPGKLVVDRNLSFGNLNRPPRKTMNRNMTFANPGRMLRSLTMRPRVFDRSRSAGNLLVQPEEDLGRFTLRLPTDVRKEVMKRDALNRTKSFATTLTNGSNRGDKIGRSDREVKSDRWNFFTRALSFSLRSPRGVVEMGESSSSGPTSVPSRSLNKLRSFNCLEPRGVDETGLMSEEPVKPSA